MNPITPAAVARLMAREETRFLAANPRSVALASRARESLFGGVPMHWMSDWSTPVPLFVSQAQGAHFTDADGHDYVDFCLGDTGSMFGHSPLPVAEAIARQAYQGLTTMLPGEDAVVCGELLAERFGLPLWQVSACATDANRYALRWARAITGRSVVILFDGCYHGTVEETLVRLRDGETVARPGLIGMGADPALASRVVPFNDPAALEAALAPGDVAAVLCEPAMTNIGMVLPDSGFHPRLRELTRRHGTLLIIDETHTLSTHPGGCTRAWSLEPDLLTLGKAIAGGLPCAVFGFTQEVASGMAAARERAASPTGHGHSGMGTTLSANAMVMHAMRANLGRVMTQAAYAHMLHEARRLAEGLRRLIERHALPWSVTELGARCEFQFCPLPPRSGAEAEAAFDDPLQRALHLYLINRGILITPFHNMMLCCPETRSEQVDRLLATLDEAIAELLAGDGYDG
ncbi:aspartate aminotransferase family protein [Aeromonas schubertii]|uniref:Aminotransferase n=1 Tax=Aeromonas schubertii TaxID=652 RepID=A0A0S2SJM6_9GAMM|nr:aspartate aminotransferase family protein [Aeromonas schubertii]ALP41921.1 aminotransferase [Aeromonas schubertii]